MGKIATARQWFVNTLLCILVGDGLLVAHAQNWPSVLKIVRLPSAIGEGRTDSYVPRFDLWPVTRNAILYTWRAQEDADEEPIATDRPDFTEASSTVPQGRIQFESGYTFTCDVADGTIHRAHTAPELLVRYGYSDDIEFRLAWTYVWESTKFGTVREALDGAEDLVVGVKLALSRQRVWWPESAVILQLGVPTGARVFSHDHLESGVNLLYGWDITERWSVAGSTGAETGSELVSVSLPLGQFSFRDQFIVYHQSVTTGWAFTDRWSGYFEYFVLHTDGSQEDRSNHFLDGGFTYLIHNDVQWDIRAGMGLNDSADDIFAGVGLSYRH